MYNSVCMSSPRMCSTKNVVFKHLTKFTRKRQCQSLFFNKVAGLEHVTLLKKGTTKQVFSCEFCEIFWNTFFTEHLRETPSVFVSALLSILQKMLFKSILNEFFFLKPLKTPGNRRFLTFSRRLKMEHKHKIH